MDQHTTLQLVPARRAPHLARTFTADTLAAWAVRAQDVEAVQLVVSELVTNGVLHAPASRAITLKLLMTGETVRVMVSDESARLPQRGGHEDGWSAEGGRGLKIVASLADRWGIELGPTRGKAVWCELRATPASRRRARTR